MGLCVGPDFFLVEKTSVTNVTNVSLTLERLKLILEWP